MLTRNPQKLDHPVNNIMVLFVGETVMQIRPLAILIIWQSPEVGPCPTDMTRVLKIWSILCSERCVFPQISPGLISGDSWYVLDWSCDTEMHL